MDFLNALILILNYTIIPALSYGSQLALGAIFVTLIYGVLRFANFATGDMMSFGTMFAVILTYYFQSIGINFGILPTALLTIPFAVFMMIFYMLTIDKFVFSCVWCVGRALVGKSSDFGEGPIFVASRDHRPAHTINRKSTISRASKQSDCDTHPSLSSLSDISFHFLKISLLTF